jgi:hypothetical protein
MSHDGLSVVGAQLDCICRTASSTVRCTGSGGLPRVIRAAAAVDGLERMRLKPCYGWQALLRVNSWHAVHIPIA